MLNFLNKAMWVQYAPNILILISPYHIQLDQNNLLASKYKEKNYSQIPQF